MKTDRRGGIVHLTKYVLFFFIILVQSCTSTSVMRLEGNDFKENLPGLWIGNYYWGTTSGMIWIDITKIVGNKVHMDGKADPAYQSAALDELYGRIENSTLIITWPKGIECHEEYKMKRDDSNNLILDGYWKCGNLNGTAQLKRIDWK